MNGALYFTISHYLIYALAAVFVPVLLSRLFRTIPYYVKNGNMGDSNNDLMFDWGKNSRGRLYNIFNETHPTAIFSDTASLAGIGLLLFIAWPLIPITALGASIIYGIVKFAQHLREQHLARKEFHRTLKGD